MNMNKKIVIIKGSGSIANKHIKILSKLNLTIYVMIKNNKEKKRFEEKNLQLIKFIKSLKNVDTKKILFCIIASSTDSHVKDIKFFIKNKVNIFCEKPISNRVNSLSLIKKEIEKEKIFFYINYQLKQHSFINKIKKIIKNEKIYHIESRVGNNLEGWRKNKIRKKSYYISNKKGGGVIFELVHEINLISFLFGNIKRIQTLKKKINIKDAEDIALSIFETENGNLGTLIQDMVARNSERYIKISTSENTYKFNLINSTFNFYKNNRLNTLKYKKLTQIDLIKKNIVDYIKWIKSNKFHTKYFDEGKRDLNICLKMHGKKK